MKKVLAKIIEKRALFPTKEEWETMPSLVRGDHIIAEADFDYEQEYAQLHRKVEQDLGTSEIDSNHLSYQEAIKILATMEKYARMSAFI